MVIAHQRSNMQLQVDAVQTCPAQCRHSLQTHGHGLNSDLQNPALSFVFLFVALALTCPHCPLIPWAVMFPEILLKQSYYLRCDDIMAAGEQNYVSLHTD